MAYSFGFLKACFDISLTASLFKGANAIRIGFLYYLLIISEGDLVERRGRLDRG